MLFLSGILIAGCGNKQQKNGAPGVESDTLLSVTVDSTELAREVVHDSIVEVVSLSLVEKTITDKVEDETSDDERFAGASVKGSTQGMNITEDKSMGGLEQKKEEAPKAVPEVLFIVEDDSGEDIEEDVFLSEDQVEWVDLDEIDYVEVEVEPSEESVFMVVEDQPEFPGGTQALLDYLRDNVKYPVAARENNIQGRVLVSFVVNKDGSIIDPEVVNKVNPLLDEEALRLVREMPKWKPGFQKGKPVRVRYTLPVNFRLN